MRSVAASQYITCRLSALNWNAHLEEGGPGDSPKNLIRSLRL